MAILTARGLGMSFGDEVLFRDGDFEIGDREAVGIIGSNGVGKTTLFRIITGEYEETSGSIIKSKDAVVGYMQQHACEGSLLTLYSELMTVFEPLTDIERRLESLSKDIDAGNGDIEKLINEQLFLTEKYQSDGGLTYKSRARAVLLGLGFEENDFYLPVSKLSGGQKSKLSLGKLLLSGANLLLLDEPTNHLDIESVEWLEGFLKEYKGSSLIISHDRYFLDKVTTKTMEIENRKITVRKGNYSVFCELKKQEQESIRRNYENTMAEVNRIEGIITQQKQWNRERNIKTAESKQKMIDRLLDGLEKPEENNESMHFHFTTNLVSGNDVLIAENLSKSFGTKLLFRNADFHITKNQRVFILGPNGCGKTTLLRILTGEEKQDSGRFEFGANVQVGYFDQNLRGLNTSKSAIDEVWDEHKDMTMTEVRNAMARFMFRGDDVYKKMSELSGGERARIALLKLMLRGCNVLLLDEPTNHLDIRAREALEDALEDYDGTLIVVSHDRYFINKLATNVVRVTSDGTEKFDGGYDSYYEKLLQDSQEKLQKASEKPKVNDYKLRKERESEIRKIKTRISKIEKEIEETENKISRIESQLSNPEISADYERVLELTNELDSTKILQEELVSEWEETSERLEKLQSEN